MYFCTEHQTRNYAIALALDLGSSLLRLLKKRILIWGDLKPLGYWARNPKSFKQQACGYYTIITPECSLSAVGSAVGSEVCSTTASPTDDAMLPGMPFAPA
jgi:hypothetical protein